MVKAADRPYVPNARTNVLVHRSVDHGITSKPLGQLAQNCGHWRCTDYSDLVLLSERQLGEVKGQQQEAGWLVGLVAAAPTGIAFASFRTT